MSAKGSATRKSAARRQAEERAALARARLAAAQRRRRLIIVGTAVGGVLLVIAVLVIVKVATGAGGPTSGQQARAASSQVVTKVSSVPAAVLNTIGVGTASPPPKPISGPPLTAGGKPRVLYVGAEYCPYCATERWAFAVALSRFGTFHNLGQTTSSATDVYPSTATLSFHGASYTSRYLSFTGKEIQSNRVVNGQYAPLDRLSAADQALFQKYDRAPLTRQAGSIPFIDLGGKYGISGAEYNPQVLHGKTDLQIATALSNPATPIAQGADGTANLITAALCKLTHGQPGAVCSSSAVSVATTALAHG